MKRRKINKHVVVVFRRRNFRLVWEMGKGQILRGPRIEANEREEKKENYESEQDGRFRRESRARFGCENMRLVRLPGRGHVERFDCKKSSSRDRVVRFVSTSYFVSPLNASRGVLFLSFRTPSRRIGIFQCCNFFLFFFFFVFECQRWSSGCFENRLFTLLSLLFFRFKNTIRRS